MSTLRNWDYYNMTGTFTDLYEKASQGSTFSHLYETIISGENILLAFRMIKTSKGSKTPGTDGRNIFRWSAECWETSTFGVEQGKSWR
ncbi:hypothetical protein [Halobacillus litoralis]|uniref:hypothetical protein n=1 Tax=Halobacillus litoralis TaxID=45668 RepID=UPI0021E60C44|nr:hypothetical protein [Halobacillus litoralis]